MRLGREGNKRNDEKTEKQKKTEKSQWDFWAERRISAICGWNKKLDGDWGCGIESRVTHLQKTVQIRVKFKVLQVPRRQREGTKQRPKKSGCPKEAALPGSS